MRIINDRINKIIDCIEQESHISRSTKHSNVYLSNVLLLYERNESLFVVEFNNSTRTNPFYHDVCGFGSSQVK